MSGRRVSKIPKPARCSRSIRHTRRCGRPSPNASRPTTRRVANCSAGSGSTTITATIEQTSATATVDVLLLKALRLPSLAAVVVVGVPSEPVGVVFTNEKGEQVTPAGDDGKVTFATADAAVATVSPEGVITGVAAGSTKLTATAKDLKAEMVITVNPAPEAAPGTVEPGKEPATDGAPKK